jgi:hypothetical protein
LAEAEEPRYENPTQGATTTEVGACPPVYREETGQKLFPIVKIEEVENGWIVNFARAHSTMGHRNETRVFNDLLDMLAWLREEMSEPREPELKPPY